MNVCANFLRSFRFSLRLIRHLPAFSSSIKVDKRAIPIAEGPNRPTTRRRSPPSRSTAQPFLKPQHTLPSRIPFSSPAPDAETRRLLLTVRSRQVRRQLQERPTSTSSRSPMVPSGDKSMNISTPATAESARKGTAAINNPLRIELE